MGVKTVQSLVSVVCEIMFIAYENDPNGEELSEQMQALFGLNIAFGVLTVLMDILVLCLRGVILEETEKERIEAARKDAERREERRAQGKVSSAKHAGSMSLPSHLKDGAQKCEAENEEECVSSTQVVREATERQGDKYTHEDGSLSKHARTNLHTEHALREAELESGVRKISLPEGELELANLYPETGDRPMSLRNPMHSIDGASIIDGHGMDKEAYVAL